MAKWLSKSNPTISAASSSSNDTSAMRERDEKNFVRQFDLER